MEVGSTIPRKESVESSQEQRPRATHGAVAEVLKSQSIGALGKRQDPVFASKK